LRKLIYAFALNLLFIHPPPLLGGEFTITRVHDGETIRGEGHGVEIVVRLAGIETPGISEEAEDPAHHLALEAKSQLAEWILNRTVEIEGHGLDELSRVVGVVYLEGVNINLEMIKSGYANVHKAEPLHSVYLLPYWKAQEIARRLGRGIWNLNERIENQCRSPERRPVPHDSSHGKDDDSDTRQQERVARRQIAAPDPPDVYGQESNPG